MPTKTQDHQDALQTKGPCLAAQASTEATTSTNITIGPEFDSFTFFVNTQHTHASRNASAHLIVGDIHIGCKEQRTMRMVCEYHGNQILETSSEEKRTYS